MGSVRYCLGRDFQPAAAAAAYFGFGELEEALIHGGGTASAGGGVDPGVIIKNDVAQAKCKLFFFLPSPSSFCLRSPAGLGYLPKRLAFDPCSAAHGHSASQGETCLAFCVPAGFHSYANTVCIVCSAMPMPHKHGILSSPTVCIPS